MQGRRRGEEPLGAEVRNEEFRRGRRPRRGLGGFPSERAERPWRPDAASDRGAEIAQAAYAEAMRAEAIEPTRESAEGVPTGFRGHSP